MRGVMFTKKMDADLAAECREKFQHFCEMYAAAKYHSEKRHYVTLAYEQVEVYLDLRDLNGL